LHPVRAGVKRIFISARTERSVIREDSIMKLNVHALSLVAGIFTAASILIVGILNLAWPGYGGAFLKMMASIYPGYHAAGTIGDLIIGVLYGLVDGLVCGLLFGWLYNRLISVPAGDGRKPPQPIEP
jgi:hypothetical protein